MELTCDAIEQNIPSYLTEDVRKNLVNSLNRFPKIDYYVDNYHLVKPEEILQGDCWSSLDLIRFENCERREIKGIILSNSCDISPENERDLPTKISFAPIIKLQNYENLLRNNSIPEDRIKSVNQSIKDQKVTNKFYLPKGGSLEEDYIALLDDIQSIPFDYFKSKTTKIKQVTLSQVGFYIFIFKLSIHFCRFNDKLIRDI